MADNSPFNMQRYDLGTAIDIGYDSNTATENLLRSQYPSHTACYVCDNPASFRILAKKPKYETAKIQDGLYACKHCLTLNIIDPKQYALREL